MGMELQQFLADAAVVAVAYAAALIFLFAGYRHAGEIWVLRHAVITQGIDKRNVWGGEWGETIIVTFAAISALVVIFFTNDVTLIETVLGHPLAIGLFLLLATVCIWAHSASTVRKARAMGRREVYVLRLRDTYIRYNFYTMCLFGMGALIVSMLIAQFHHDGAVFSEEAARITAAFAEAQRLASEDGGSHAAYARAVAEAETGFSGIALAGKALQNQFNPMFIFAGTLIVINIAINLTKMKGMFTGGAVSMTALFTYGPLVVIGAVGLLVYLNVYEVMLSDSLARLQSLTPPARFGDWELSQRHAQMVVEMSNARNIFGFAQTIAGEGGGFAILAWGVQTALEKIGDTKDAEKVRMPLKKFRPDDGRSPRRQPAGS